MAPKLAAKAAGAAPKAAGAPVAKAAGAPVAKAVAKPRMRPRNGRAVHRGLISVRNPPPWIRDFERRYAENRLDTTSTQIISNNTAIRVAEWLLHQSSAQQGRLMHMMAVFRCRTLIRILGHYHTRRQASQLSVHRALDSVHRVHPIVVAPSGTVMG